MTATLCQTKRGADCQIYTETFKDALAIQGEIMAIKEAQEPNSPMLLAAFR
jgi:hypothetical protein